MLQLRKIARVIVPVLMLMVVCFLTNMTINQHYHKLSSGLVIKHAHPYDKGKVNEPFQEHHHTSSELVFLEQMYNTVFWMYLFIIFPFAPFFLIEITSSPLLVTFKNPSLYFLRNYHAPPYSSY